MHFCGFKPENFKMFCDCTDMLEICKYSNLFTTKKKNISCLVLLHQRCNPYYHCRRCHTITAFSLIWFMNRFSLSLYASDSPQKRSRNPPPKMTKIPATFCARQDCFMRPTTAVNEAAPWQVHENIIKTKRMV